MTTEPFTRDFLKIVWGYSIMFNEHPGSIVHLAAIREHDGFWDWEATYARPNGKTKTWGHENSSVLRDGERTPVRWERGPSGMRVVRQPGPIIKYPPDDHPFWTGWEHY